MFLYSPSHSFPVVLLLLWLLLIDSLTGVGLSQSVMEGTFRVGEQYVAATCAAELRLWCDVTGYNAVDVRCAT